MGSIDLHRPIQRTEIDLARNVFIVLAHQRIAFLKTLSDGIP